jgi:tyrosinase
MIELFEILHEAKDWDQFYKTAVAAREVTNEGQFFYAFSVAILHREEGFILPPPYEVFPHLFTTSDVVRQAYRAKMTQTPTVIPMNFTGTIRNTEQRVSYFGEDVGMNSHHSHWHQEWPFWMEEKHGEHKDRKGELFWYMHHQLTARFDAERLSNNLNKVEPLHWDKPILEGFVPKAQYKSGHEFPSRPDNMNFQDLPFLTINDMKQYETRIRKSIAAGFVLNDHWEKVSINGTEGIDTLGSIIEASACSINHNYYGSLHNNAHIMLSRVTDPKGKFGIKYGVLEHFETATRDPAFFRLHKYIDNLVKEHKDLLPSYTRGELELPGVQVDAVKVIGKSKASTPNLLVTYFQDFYFDLTNALDSSKNVKDVDIQAKVSRLSHEPFEYVITATSDAEKNAIARIFIAPKYDYYGEENTLDKMRWQVIELDKFVVHLKPGQNVIHRSSESSSVTIPDRKGFKELTKTIEEAIEGKHDYNVNKKVRHCGLPQGLLLPKGKPEGMKFKLIVALTDHEHDFHAEHYHDCDDNSLSYCGNLGGINPDKRPMGFPFDRKIACVDTFRVHNIKSTEVTIQNIPK